MAFIELEFLELLANLRHLARGSKDLKHVEAHGLRERPALADDDLIALLYTEARRHVGGRVGVALLETVVLLYKVEVVTAHNDGAAHLGAGDSAGEQSSSNRNHSGERAFLVDVVACDGLPGRLDAETNIANESDSALRLLGNTLAAEDVNVGLLLESALVLHRFSHLPV